MDYEESWKGLKENSKLNTSIKTEIRRQSGKLVEHMDCHSFLCQVGFLDSWETPWAVALGISRKGKECEIVSLLKERRN